MNAKVKDLKYSNQRGAALVVSMILLIILTILVLGSLRGAAMNSKMATNAQINTSFKTPVDGEVYAQMTEFSQGGNEIDKVISKAIAANGGAFTIEPKINKKYFRSLTLVTPTFRTQRECVNLAKMGVKDPNSATPNTAQATGQNDGPGQNDNIYDCFVVSLHDLTKKAATTAIMPWKKDNFIHGRLCQGFGQTVGCKNMVVNVEAEADKLGGSSQSVGFGVVAPKDKGVQGIKNES